MRVWLASCVVLFGMVELYQWFKNFTLPLPVFILSGAFLAIASNYNKLASLLFRDSAAQQPPLSGSVNSGNWDNLNQSQAKPALKPHQSVSFTIRRSVEQRHPTEPE